MGHPTSVFPEWVCQLKRPTTPDSSSRRLLQATVTAAAAECGFAALFLMWPLSFVRSFWKHSFWHLMATTPVFCWVCKRQLSFLSKKNNDLNATRKTLPISGFVRKKCLLQFFPDEPGYTGSENVWKIIVCRTPLPDKVLS